MSYRERRNRKDSHGKTPDQLRKNYPRHEQTYGELTEGLTEEDFPLSPTGYLQGIRTTLDGPAFEEPSP